MCFESNIKCDFKNSVEDRIKTKLAVALAAHATAATTTCWLPESLLFMYECIRVFFALQHCAYLPPFNIASGVCHAFFKTLSHFFQAYAELGSLYSTHEILKIFSFISIYVHNLLFMSVDYIGPIHYFSLKYFLFEIMPLLFTNSRHSQAIFYDITQFSFNSLIGFQHSIFKLPTNYLFNLRWNSLLFYLCSAISSTW